MKKLLVALFVVVAVGSLGRVYYMKSALASRYSLSDLQSIAAEANKSLPVMVDPQTRLESVVASDHFLEKRYTLVSAQASKELADVLTTKLFPILKAQSCQDKQSLNLYQSGVGEGFTYSDMNGELIATFIINKSSCS